MGGGSDLPEAAERRIGHGAFSSGLTVPDFAACLQMGLQPVGFVQGFCVMQWQWYGMGSPFGVFGSPVQTSGYSETWRCPHGMVSAEHRSWGQNFEQSWVEDAWTTGFSAACHRMVEEATEAKAHGVVGVVDTSQPLAGEGVLEFHVKGTAVTVEGLPLPKEGQAPWTTYLAGQRLAKLVEAGYAPVSIAAGVASVRVWANCITGALTEGMTSAWMGRPSTMEIEQTAKAAMAARQIAREHVRAQLGGDSLHGATLYSNQQEMSEGDAEFQCILRGNRVRRFKPFDPVPPPRPTVRLS
jgi:hypothetical protein